MSDKKGIRIGGACGFWGESAGATPQLLAAGNIDYIVYDYLAEITMSIMARARAANPDRGYATDFVGAVLCPNLKEIARQGVKVISNAGGVNPEACAVAIRDLIAADGLDLRVAVITGDDLMPSVGQIAAMQPKEMFSGAPFPDPDSLASMNAYLGAFPIAQALGQGADIIVTGRVVDSAVTLGACIHEFNWSAQEFDLLAAGSLAGHILECGPQATGGNFTDWELVSESYYDIGYPITEISADGSFVCSKAEGSGGIVSTHSVCEQMLYEIGDPRAYILPDVVCDFSEVTLEQISRDQVRVAGALGRPPPETLKVSATYADGYRGGQNLLFYGFDADRKAHCFAEVALQRARAALQRHGLEDFSETCVELIGNESHYGGRRAVSSSREVALKIAARHPRARGLATLFKEATGMALGAPPGLTGFAGGRPKPSPVIRLFSFELNRSQVDVFIEVDGHSKTLSETFDAVPVAAVHGGLSARPEFTQSPCSDEETVEVPLIKLALGRSGDKGDKANIGIIARRPEYLCWIWAGLDESVIAQTFSHFLKGPVERFLLPGTHSINFLLHEVLGGGGMASLRNDPQGKGFAQLALDLPVAVPKSIAESL